jgi:hypothetical protein
LAGTPTRAYHRFLGWATQANAAVADYQPGDSYTADAPAVLFALWEEITYDLRFHYGNGAAPYTTSFGAVDVTYYLNRVALFAPAPAREACVLIGWADTPGAAVPQYALSGAVTPTADSDYYAVWQFIANTSGGQSVTITPADAFPWGTRMEVRVTGSNTLAVAATPGQIVSLLTYSITFEGLQPTAPVTVRLSIPQWFIDDGHDTSDLLVLHKSDTYGGAGLPLTVGQSSDGRHYLEFEASSFSDYTIVWDCPQENGNNNQDGKNWGLFDWLRLLIEWIRRVLALIGIRF